MKRHLIRAMAVALALLLIAACSGPEEKKLRFYNKGKELYEKGDFVSAGLEFKNALQIDPKYAEAWHMMGLVELKKGNLRAAYGDFNKAAELKPDLWDSHNQLARIYLAGQMLDRVAEKVDLVLKGAPDNEEALLLKGALLVARKDVDAAKGHLEGLIAKGITKPDAYLLLSVAFAQKNDLSAVESTLQKGIAANGKSAAIYVALSNFYLGQKRTEDAAGTVRKLIEIEPDNVGHRLRLANLYWESGRQQEGIDVLKALVAADPSKEDSWLQYAGFFIAKGKFEEAERELKAGIQQNGKSAKIRFALADFYMNTNRVDQAVDILKEGLGLARDAASPEVLQAKNALARVYLGRQQIDEAKKYVEEVLKESPKNPEALFTRGNVYLAKGDALHAIPDFRAVVTDNPQMILGHVRLAEAHAMNREMNLAVDTIQNGLKIDPKSRDLLRTLARLQASQGDYRSAEANFRKVMEAHPKDLETLADLGDVHLAARDYRKAEGVYMDLRQKAPNVPISYVKMSGLYLSQGKLDRATAEMEQAVSRNRGSQQLASGLVDLYIGQKKYGPALSLCEARLKENPLSAFNHNLLGHVQAAQADYAKAEASFLKAIELEAQWPVPHNNLARLYLAQGKKDIAVRRFEESLKANPDNMAAYLSLGQIHVMDKDYPKAIEVYERALARLPHSWVVANDLAFLLSETAKSGADLDKAFAMAQKAQGMRPDAASVQDTLGWIHFKKGDVNKALELIGKAKAQSPENASINYHMGMALQKAGKKDQAKEHLKKALASREEFIGRDEARKTLETI